MCQKGIKKIYKGTQILLSIEYSNVSSLSPGEEKSILSPYKGHAFVFHWPDQLNSLSQDCNAQIRKILIAKKYNTECSSDRKKNNCLNVLGTETHPSVDNDLLILTASLSRSPSAPDDRCLFQVEPEQLEFW
jgi:hypothetical protein